MNKAAEYIKKIQTITENVLQSQLTSIESAAREVAAAQADGRKVFLFGTGHSHMLAEEMFYRAGGLVNIRPIFEEGLMLHSSASKSTGLERLSGYAEIIFDHYRIGRGDVLFIFSNSGRNGVCVDMAQLADKRGLTLIALTNMRQTMSAPSRHPSGKRLFEYADIVIDNMGCVGDASIGIEGFDRKVAPTSTVIGAMIMNAIEARAVEILVQKGIEPEVFASSNIEGGDEINDRYLRKYLGEIDNL